MMMGEGEEEGKEEEEGREGGGSVATCMNASR